MESSFQTIFSILPIWRFAHWACVAQKPQSPRPELGPFGLSNPSATKTCLWELPCFSDNQGIPHMNRTNPLR